MSITVGKSAKIVTFSMKEPQQLETCETYITQNGSLLYVTEDCDSDNVWIVLHLAEQDKICDGTTNPQDVKVVSIIMEVL